MPGGRWSPSPPQGVLKTKTEVTYANGARVRRSSWRVAAVSHIKGAHAWRGSVGGGGWAVRPGVLVRLRRSPSVTVELGRVYTCFKTSWTKKRQRGHQPRTKYHPGWWQGWVS